MFPSSWCSAAAAAKAFQSPSTRWYKHPSRLPYQPSTWQITTDWKSLSSSILLSDHSQISSGLSSLVSRFQKVFNSTGTHNLLTNHLLCHQPPYDVTSFSPSFSSMEFASLEPSIAHNLDSLLPQPWLVLSVCSYCQIQTEIEESGENH